MSTQLRPAVKAITSFCRKFAQALVRPGKRWELKRNLSQSYFHIYPHDFRYHIYVDFRVYFTYIYIYIKGESGTNFLDVSTFAFLLHADHGNITMTLMSSLSKMIRWSNSRRQTFTVTLKPRNLTNPSYIMKVSPLSQAYRIQLE